VSTIISDVVGKAERQAAAKLRLRRTVVRVHMWIALGLGLYITVLSVSGSAIVFRREYTTWLVPRVVPSTAGERLTGDALVAALANAYPDDTVVDVREPRRPERPVSVILERDGATIERLFDQYAARDLGETCRA
jgi:uncharacterized iron-regulated membrane protein